MPLMVALARLHPYAALAAVVMIWAVAQTGLVSLPAEPWSERRWFFNPFGWQLVFFTGFAFMAGWLPAPPVTRRLVLLAAVIVLVILPLAYFRIYREVALAAEWREALSPYFNKTDFGILRYVHFLALAYLAWVAVGPVGVRLEPPSGDGIVARGWRVVLAMILKVGQQSLAVFIASMYLARLMGAALDVLGRTHLAMAVVNMVGVVVLIGVAYSTGWFKSAPWQPRPAR
jgi:hypothetical protein